MLSTATTNAQKLVDVVTAPERRAAYLASRHWDGTLLARRLSQFAASQPDKLAIVDMLGQRKVNFGDFDRYANKAAHMLASLGVRAGDVVAVQMPNWIETVVIDLAVMKLGAVLNPMLPIYRAREVGHMLSVGRTRVIITPQVYRGFDYREMVAALRPTLPDLVHHIAVAQPDGIAGDFWDRLAGFPAEAPAIDIDPDWVGMLSFTSGTESQPKAVMQTENGMNIEMRALFDHYGMDENDVVWVPSPVGHATGLKDGLRLAVYSGLTMVLQDKWDGKEAARLIQDFRCTYTVAATTFVRDLVDAGKSGEYDLSSLRLFGSGGAPIPAELVVEAERLGIIVLRLYGGTEMAMVTTCRPDCPLDKRIQTDGKALDHVEVEVRDENGKALIGECGEIYARGPNTSVGYFADPERTAKTFLPGGWVRTGDSGVLDADGYLTIIGRVKEIIIRGGMNIAPRELEDILLTHPDVQDVSVIGFPDDRLGETVCACIVPAGGKTVGVEDIGGFLKSLGVAAYKLPQRVEIVDALPRTTTGKTQKFLLVDMVKKRDVT